MTSKRQTMLSILLTLILILSLTACSKKSIPAADESTESTAGTTVGEETEKDLTASGDTEWAIYWYLCGSDLESEGGAATVDLYELLEVQLPENVKIIIETGGTNLWQNDFMSATNNERYVYDHNGLQLIEQLPLSNMGSEETLSSFLAFAKENYPAEKTAFVFWNHGGGSVSGAAFDQNFENDSLSLIEMHNAFAANYELSAENPPFDLIGFDTCLMATVDVAYNFSDIGKYMVASQETEPGNGWLYSGWGSALSANPAMDAVELGTIICDTYAEGCELVGTSDNITLSLTDLSMVQSLMSVYNDYGKEALASACADPTFFTYFSRVGEATENYGGNTKEQGYTNMADLGHLARQTTELLPDTSALVLEALDSCVVYKVNGPYRSESTGLSCYISYNGDIDDLSGYIEEGAGDAFKYYYTYGLTNQLPDEGMDYIAEMSYETLQPIETLESQGWENHPLDVDDEGFATLNLGPTAIDVLSGIYIQLYYVDYEQDIMLLLGSDNDLYADWETGEFKDNFRGVWGAINGCLVYMELSYEGDDYNLYNVPILLNGEDYNLSVVYDFNLGTYEIQGAKKPIDESGMADKNLRALIEGDVITTIHYMSSVSGDDELVPVEVDEILVDDSLVFEEVDMGDGTFLQLFEMVDMQGYTAYSDVITFEVLGGDITTSVGYTE